MFVAGVSYLLPDFPNIDCLLPTWLLMLHLPSLPAHLLLTPDVPLMHIRHLPRLSPVYFLLLGLCPALCLKLRLEHSLLPMNMQNIQNQDRYLICLFLYQALAMEYIAYETLQH